MAGKVMAIMKGIGFGVRDMNFAMLWFTAHDGDCGASLQCIPAKKAIELIEKHGIESIADLEGKPCWVQHDNGLVKFVDFVKI